MSTPEQPTPVNDTPIRKAPSTGTVLRRVGAVLLSLLCTLALFAGSALRAADALVGTPRAASNAFLSVISVDGVDRAIAVAVLDDISNHTTPAIAASIDANRAALEAAVVTTIHEPATRALVRIDIRTAYGLLERGTAGTIDLGPLVARFTSAMHQVDPAIPADPHLVVTSSLMVDITPHHGFNISNALNVTGWLLISFGVIGAVLVARFMVRNQWRQLLCVGLTIGVPALLLALVGLRSSGIASAITFNDPTANVLARQTLEHVGSTIASTAGLLALIDAVVILGWLAIRMLWARTRRGDVVAAPPASV